MTPVQSSGERPSGENLVRAEEDVVACSLAEGIALLDLRSSTYYSLNEVGACIWEQLGQPVSVDHLCGAVVEQFAVNSTRVRSDVENLLACMHKAGLIRTQHAVHG